MLKKYRQQKRLLQKKYTYMFLPQLLASILVLFLSSGKLVFGDLYGDFESPLKFDTLQDLLLAIIDTVILVMAPLIALMIVYTGFLFVQAQGNASKLEAARNALMWCFLGGLIVLGAYGIASAIEATVGSLM